MNSLQRIRYVDNLLNHPSKLNWLKINHTVINELFIHYGLYHYVYTERISHVKKKANHITKMFIRFMEDNPDMFISRNDRLIELVKELLPSYMDLFLNYPQVSILIGLYNHAYDEGNSYFEEMNNEYRLEHEQQDYNDRDIGFEDYTDTELGFNDTISSIAEDQDDDITVTSEGRIGSIIQLSIDNMDIEEYLEILRREFMMEPYEIEHYLLKNKWINDAMKRYIDISPWKDNDSKECPVCFEDISQSSLLSCGHKIHSKCIILSKKICCPMCRQHIKLTRDDLGKIYDLNN